MKTLPSGITGFYNDRNEWQCTGSQMGRRSWRGHDANTSVKVWLRRMKMSACGCYDEQGAYWGQGAPLYWANFDIGETNEDMFFRAYSRDDAKAKVREQLPNARFYR